MSRQTPKERLKYDLIVFLIAAIVFSIYQLFKLITP